jgi:hypothetical protein
MLAITNCDGILNGIAKQVFNGFNVNSLYYLAG